MEQVAKLKRTWNLAPILQIAQKIPKNYCPCLYLSIIQVCWLNELWFKRCIQKCALSHTNTHHDVTDLVNRVMVRNAKPWISWKGNITFLRNKKFLICADVTFNPYVPNEPFLYLLRFSEGREWVHWERMGKGYWRMAPSELNINNQDESISRILFPQKLSLKDLILEVSEIQDITLNFFESM